MHTSFKRLRLPAALVLFVALCGAATPTPPSWPQKMGRLASLMRVLLPEALSPGGFSSVEKRTAMLRDVQALRALAHQVSTAKDRGNDPSIQVMSVALTDSLEEAEAAIAEGNADYARVMMMQVTQACFACHTRTDSGVRFPTLAVDDNSTMKPFERALLLGATRRFDESFAIYQTIIRDPRAPLDRGMEWDSSITNAVTLAVRTRKSPELAMTVTQDVLNAPSAPFYLKQVMLHWQDSIRQWQAEPPSLATETVLLSRARGLLRARFERHSDAPVGAAAVDELRASALLHESLERFPDGARAQEALFLLGLAYQSLPGQEQWLLYPSYFEACVKKGPHSSMALRCFEHYQAAMFTQFGGSGGYMPSDAVQRKLHKLLKLAEPDGSTKAPVIEK